jgi:hypothetical protein
MTHARALAVGLIVATVVASTQHDSERAGGSLESAAPRAASRA